MAAQTSTNAEAQAALSPLLSQLEAQKTSIHRAYYPLDWLMTSIKIIVNTEAENTVNAGMLRDVEAAAHAVSYLLPAFEEAGVASQSEVEAFQGSLSEFLKILLTRNEKSRIASVCEFLNTDAKERADGLWVLAQTFHSRLSQKACDTEKLENALQQLITPQTDLPQELLATDPLISEAILRFGVQETQSIMSAALRKALKEDDRRNQRRAQRVERQQYQEALQLDQLRTRLSSIISDESILDVYVKHFKTLAESRNHKSHALPSSGPKYLEERIKEILDKMHVEGPKETENVKKMISSFPSLLVDDHHLINIVNLNETLGFPLLTLLFERSPAKLESIFSSRTNMESFSRAVCTRFNILRALVQGQQIFSTSFADAVFLNNPDFLLDESIEALHAFEHKLKGVLRVINGPGVKGLISQSERSDILDPAMCQKNFSSGEAIQNTMEFVKSLSTDEKQETVDAEGERQKWIQFIAESEAVKNRFKKEPNNAAELIYIVLDKGTLHHGNRLSGHMYRGAVYALKGIKNECQRRGIQGLADRMLKDVISFLVNKKVLEVYKRGETLKLQAHPDEVSDPVLGESLKYFLSLSTQNGTSS